MAAYQAGRYAGAIAVDPASGAGGSLGFTVRGHRISGLAVSEPGMVCVGDGGSGVATTIDFTLRLTRTLAVSRAGAFSFHGRLSSGKRLALSGTLRGTRATGTIALGANGPGATSCLTSHPLRFRAVVR